MWVVGCCTQDCVAPVRLVQSTATLAGRWIMTWVAEVEVVQELKDTFAKLFRVTCSFIPAPPRPHLTCYWH
jgi:hypothetical protein